eukprot:8080822-Alexandrium_andersonii.AAC.1
MAVRGGIFRGVGRETACVHPDRPELSAGSAPAPQPFSHAAPLWRCTTPGRQSALLAFGLCRPSNGSACHFWGRRHIFRPCR